MSGSSGDKHDGPVASVHRLDPDRPRRRRSLPKAPAAPNEERPAPDRNTGLSMLGTFDLDDVDFRSPDEMLATLASEPTVSGLDDPSQTSPVDERAATRDIPAVEEIHSDEILRELEEHHHRGQLAPRPSAPRGSAELQPVVRRTVPSTRKREARGGASGGSKPRGGHKRLVLSLAAAAVFTATAGAVTLSQLGGIANRPPTPIRSSRLTATTGLTLAPTKFFNAAANAIAKEDRPLTPRVKSPARHHRRVASVRKRSARRHVVTHATVASTTPASSTPSYSSSSSTAASSSQPATSGAAAATSTSTTHQSQPAFGQNGSLGPGRGAAGTQ
jgi:hypothetical protein